MSKRIRIESHEDVVKNARILLVDDEGGEVDVSSCVTGVDVSLHVGEIARASLHVLRIEGSVTADLVDVLIRDVRRPRSRRWRLADVTTFVSGGARRVMKAARS